MDIEGPGAASLTVSGSGWRSSTVFTVDASVSATIAGLTITGGAASYGGGIFNAGTLTLGNAVVSGNHAGNGGGIENEGTMTITASTVSNNSATSYFTAPFESAAGGGIYNDGTLTIDNSVIASNSANDSATGWSVNAGNGGGIYNGGTLNVYNSVIASNEAVNSIYQGCCSGLNGGASVGGGIDNESGFVSLVDSQISQNTSNTGGGGIHSSGTLSLSDCTVIGNQIQAPHGLGAVGGGLAVDSGSLQITDSMIQGNQVQGGSDTGYFPLPPGVTQTLDGSPGFGGGLSVVNATASISRVTIAGNSAAGAGGGLWYEPWGWEVGEGGESDGGGLFFAGSSLSVVNCTLSGNTASGGDGGGYGLPLYPPVTDGLGGTSFGGGIGLSGSGTFANDTIVGNSASGGLGGGHFEYVFDPITGEWSKVWSPDYQATTYGGGLGVQAGTAALYNSIVALNSTDVGLGAGTLSTDSAYNLIGTGGSGGLTSSNGNQVGVADPGLAPLGNYGGPTQTIALLPGSPAIGAGFMFDYPGTSTPITTDQRGMPRGSLVDIGAFQTSLMVESTYGWVDTTPSDLTLPGAVSLANQFADSTITFDPTVFASAQTITLADGQLELSNTTGTETITGPAAGVTVSAGWSSGVFQVDSGVTASISGLTITDGLAAQGGGLSIDGGTVVLTSVTVINNLALGVAVRRVSGAREEPAATAPAALGAAFTWVEAA